VIAFCCSTTISFFLYKLWAFQNYSKDKMRMQYLYTLLFAALMIGLNTLLVYTFVELIMPWHLGYLVAQVLASIVTTLVNYIFYHKIIFKEKEINFI
jgi:putative flippase GtrA